MPTLYIYPKLGPSFSVEIGNEPLTFGRSGDNSVPLVDPFCSGRHALIRPAEGGYVLEDAGSKNGTYLNGRRVAAPTELHIGDEVRIGGVRMVFDRPPSARVEMTDDAVATTRVNTVVPSQDLLLKKAVAAGAELLAEENEIAAVMAEVSGALALHRPLPELVERIMDIIGSHVSMDRGVLMLTEGRPPRLETKVVRVHNAALRGEPIPISRGIVAMAFEQKLSILTTDAAADPRFMSRESIVQVGIRSALCVPLWDNREVVGVLYADRLSPVRPFGERDLRLLTLLANLAAVKIENARLVEKALESERMRREMERAAKVQRDFLPKATPLCPQLDIAGKAFPCLEVGGDYYDFLVIDPCRIGFAIADVSGKGVGASLLMASLRASLHAEVGPDVDLARVAAKLNDFVHRSSDLHVFITFFFGEMDITTGAIRYINAGHPAPLIVGSSGPTRALPGTGLALGMLAGSTYDVGEARIEPGEVWILYTDGLTESRNAAGEEFGTERIENAVRESKETTAAAGIDRVFAALNAFTGNAEAADDRTLVVVKRRS